MINIPNILHLNDWEHKKFLRIMLVIHIGMLGAIGLDFMGMEIPILRQVVGFIYLTFVPGIIILRLLRLHKLGAAETVLLSTGLSVSFLMFSGFFLNTIFSLLKINSPLSFWNVVIFITVLLTVLSILSYKIDRVNRYELPPLKITRISLYLMILPVVSILGAYLVNFHNNNIVLLILIILIALIPVLVALNKIPSELYPLAIVVIAVSLLFHRSLISMYLTGWDIHQEYYFYKLVVDNGHWSSEISGNVNAMLSIVILPALYSYFLKIDGAWVFKIVYPILFSLVPLGLYCVYQREIKNEKIAFYSVFFFMSFVTFYTEMISLARQEIAELFYVLLIFMMVQDTKSANIRNILLLIFGASLVTSHYGLSYIFFILMIIIYLFSTDLIKPLTRWLKLPEFNLKRSTLNFFIIFYIVFLIVWYFNVSESSAFRSIVRIGDHVITSIFTELFDPGNRDRSVLMAIGLVDPVVPSLGREIFRGLQFTIQFFIITGFFKIIVNREYSRIKAEYFYLIVASLGILVLSLLPFAAKALNMSRIYHIVLIVISPLAIVGGIFVIENLMKIILIKLKCDHAILILVTVILIPYLLFNTGFIFEMTNDSPTSMSLGMERMKNYNITKISFYNTYTPEQDVYSARWLYTSKNADKIIYADGDSKLHVLMSYGMTPFAGVKSLYVSSNLNKFDIGSHYYMYMNKNDVCENNQIINNSLIFSLFTNQSRIYSNGCGEIYEK